jgi:hypothetical protein
MQCGAKYDRTFYFSRPEQKTFSASKLQKKMRWKSFFVAEGADTLYYSFNPALHKAHVMCGVFYSS